MSEEDKKTAREQILKYKKSSIWYSPEITIV